MTDQTAQPPEPGGRRQGWETYRRIGRVRARRATEVVHWQTDSGDQMTGHPGDWIVKELAGHSIRTVVNEEFARTYRLVADDIYERIGTVEARPSVPGEVIESNEGRITARGGEWVLRRPGFIWLAPDEAFRNGYEPLD